MKRILHLDMDAFFASIEERDNPELLGLPISVGAVVPRGVVAAAGWRPEAQGDGAVEDAPGQGEIDRVFH